MLQDADNSVSERTKQNAKLAPQLEEKFYWLGYWNGRQDEQTFSEKNFRSKNDHQDTTRHQKIIQLNS